MCTGGRIRLFWGVSPDFMALALRTRSPGPFTCLHRSGIPISMQTRKRSCDTFGLLIKYIYIYIQNTYYRYASYLCVECVTDWQLRVLHDLLCICLHVIKWLFMYYIYIYIYIILGTRSSSKFISCCFFVWYTHKKTERNKLHVTVNSRRGP